MVTGATRAPDAKEDSEISEEPGPRHCTQTLGTLTVPAESDHTAQD